MRYLIIWRWFDLKNSWSIYPRKIDQISKIKNIDGKSFIRWERCYEVKRDKSQREGIKTIKKKYEIIKETK